MFRRKKDDDIGGSIMPHSDEMSHAEPATPARQFTRPAAPATSNVAASAHPGAGRSAMPGSSSGARPTTGRERPVSDGHEGKKLMVGREIVLSGQITSCDRLIVEGRVEATLSDSKAIEIAESGFFKGSAEIDSADIAGNFEGNLTVRERITIRSTGRVTGQIRYGQIEIEAGGEIGGDIQPQRAAKAATSGASTTNGREAVPYAASGPSD